MKITGKRRAEYFLTVCFFWILFYVARSVITESYNDSFSQLIFPILFIAYGYLTFKYIAWLKNPSIDLKTIKVRNIYINTNAISDLGLILIFLMILIPFSVLTTVLTENVFGVLSYICREFLLLLWFTARVTNGPEPPTKTIWAQAKEKIAALRESHQYKPVLIPSPVRV